MIWDLFLDQLMYSGVFKDNKLDLGVMDTSKYSQNREKEGFPIYSQNGIEKLPEQNNTTKLSGYSFNNIYNKMTQE